jgi:hypothetical protein
MPLPPKEAKSLRRALKKLKLSKEVQNILFEMKVELYDLYDESFKHLQDTIKMWERLYLDKPEDRLWHAKDGTWWKRLHGAEKVSHQKMEEHYQKVQFGKKVKAVLPEYGLYRASPPPEIHAVIFSAHLVLNAFLKKAGKKQPKELVEAISALSRSLKPFYDLPYMRPYRPDYTR